MLNCILASWIKDSIDQTLVDEVIAGGLDYEGPEQDLIFGSSFASRVSRPFVASTWDERLNGLDVERLTVVADDFLLDACSDPRQCKMAAYACIVGLGRMFSPGDHVLVEMLLADRLCQACLRLKDQRLINGVLELFNQARGKVRDGGARDALLLLSMRLAIEIAHSSAASIDLPRLSRLAKIKSSVVEEVVMHHLQGLVHGSSTLHFEVAKLPLVLDDSAGR